MIALSILYCNYTVIFVKFVAYIVVRFVCQLCIVKKAQTTTITSMVITIHFLHTGPQCTITPLNPTTLTDTGGALAIGTKHVRFRCVCTGSVVRWYDPSVTIIFKKTHWNRVARSPYVIRDSNNMKITLVIPTFNDSYDGTYNCGIRVNDTSFTSPSAAINLTITGELMINTVSYLYVAT